MTNDTRSIRLPDSTHRFIDQSGFDFPDETRDWLQGQQVKYAAGVCAACGNLVYASGTTGPSHTVTSGSTPLGTVLGLARHEQIDLCPDHSDEAMRAVSGEAANPPALAHLHEYWENYYLYRAERDAVADAQPDADWATLITNRDGEFFSRSDALRAITTWAQTTERFETEYATDGIQDALLTALHEAAPDEDALFSP